MEMSFKARGAPALQRVGSSCQNVEVRQNQ